MTSSGAILLAPSGLIKEANSKALELLGYANVEILNKPISLFVRRDDLVVYFSHWNELRNHTQQQPFEIALKHKDGGDIYLRLQFELDTKTDAQPQEIRVVLNEISDSRKASAQMQFQEDLLNLVFTITDSVNTASDRHLESTIQDALKKICLVTEADRCFIHRFNRRHKRLVPAYRWEKEERSENAAPEFDGISLKTIKQIIVRLRQESAYVVNDVAQLPPDERRELTDWHPSGTGAIVCHLVYAAKRPVGIIGIVKRQVEEQWPPQCIALVKFLGQLLSDRLRFEGEQHSTAYPNRRPHLLQEASSKPLRKMVHDLIDSKANPGPAAEHAAVFKRPDSPEPTPVYETSFGASAISRRMKLEKRPNHELMDEQPVYPRDDGLVLLTCDKCGFQDSVSLREFEELGNALSVTCTCGKNFTAVLEKRRAHRKRVNLAGHFTLEGEMDPENDKDSVYGVMVVRDLSKAGLRFSSSNANLVQRGDLLMVRFHLDNYNRALIHKPARVISVIGDEVGCKFEGADSDDITLGFYFI